MPNSRRIFTELMETGLAPRVPLFEEGIRQDVIDAWRQQGLPHDLNHFDFFHYDRYIEVFPELGPLPEPIRWPTTVEDLRGFKTRLNPDDPRRLIFDKATQAQLDQSTDVIRILRVHRGFFTSVGVSEWDRFEEVMLLAMDNSGLLQEILTHQGALAAQLVQRFLADHQVEAALFSEPIGGNHGPLISPKMYAELVLPTYRPIFQVLKKNGVNTIIWRTYANTRALLPAVIEAGINCLWACECETAAMDYALIRKNFGTDLRLIGGIDLKALHGDLTGIKKEIETKVPPLLEQGGYLPLLDGRVRKMIPFENYRYFRQTLENLICQVKT